MDLGRRRRAKQGEAIELLNALKRVDRDDWPDDCVEWPFSRNDRGYGKALSNGRYVYTHREMCVEFHGDQPDLEVCHDNAGKPCASRACLNPKHLRWGSRAENMADMVVHGHTNRGRTMTNSPKGADHGMAVLNESAVQAIRVLHRTGMFSMKSLGSKFGVSATQIHKIVHRARWAHVHDAVLSL